ncbi:Serine/threonine-protein kinase [Blastocladiella emersonii ATCC 22665]|nr:Serine/threonine-protein kinase [Blastocladiella emersonii ATCC 22665]
MSSPSSRGPRPDAGPPPPPPAPPAQQRAATVGPGAATATAGPYPPNVPTHDALPVPRPPAAAPHPLPPLVLLGEYTVCEEIGRGSFATVYRGVAATAPHANVAVKAIPLAKLTRKLMANLNSEIDILRAMAKLRHPHIVNLIAWERRDADAVLAAAAGTAAVPGTAASAPSGIAVPERPRAVYLIMDWCAWGDLSQFLRKKTKRSAGPPVTRGALLQLAARICARPGQPVAADALPLAGEWGGLHHTYVMYLLGQLVSALDFLRAHSLMHRDLKPQNLLLHPPTTPGAMHSGASPLFPAANVPGNSRFAHLFPPSSSSPDAAGGGGGVLGDLSNPALAMAILPRLPELKLADFGFARYLPTPTSLAETLCGSPLYMAPEILRYEKYDTRADLWSVGAILYELLFGRVPFRAQNHIELLRKIEKYKDRIRIPQRALAPGSSSSTAVPAGVGAASIPTPPGAGGARTAPVPIGGASSRPASTVAGGGGAGGSSAPVVGGHAHSAPSALRIVPGTGSSPVHAALLSPTSEGLRLAAMATPAGTVMATNPATGSHAAAASSHPLATVSTEDADAMLPLYLAEDEHDLICRLLKQQPAQRMTLDDFFRHPVVVEARALSDAVAKWRKGAYVDSPATAAAAAPVQAPADREAASQRVVEQVRRALPMAVVQQGQHPSASAPPAHAAAPIPIASAGTRHAPSSRANHRSGGAAASNAAYRDHSVSPSPPDTHVGRPISMPNQSWANPAAAAHAQRPRKSSGSGNGSVVLPRQPSIPEMPLAGSPTAGTSPRSAMAGPLAAPPPPASPPAPARRHPAVSDESSATPREQPLRKTPSVGQMILQRKSLASSSSGSPPGSAAPVPVATAPPTSMLTALISTIDRDYILIDKEAVEVNVLADHRAFPPHARPASTPPSSSGGGGSAARRTSAASPSPSIGSNSAAAAAAAAANPRRSSFSLFGLVGKIITTTASAIQSGASAATGGGGSSSSAGGSGSSPGSSVGSLGRTRGHSGSGVVESLQQQHLLAQQQQQQQQVSAAGTGWVGIHSGSAPRAIDAPAPAQPQPQQSDEDPRVPTFTPPRTADPQIIGLVAQFEAYARKAWALATLTQTRLPAFIRGRTADHDRALLDEAARTADEIVGISNMALAILAAAMDRVKVFLAAAGLEGAIDGVDAVATAYQSHSQSSSSKGGDGGFTPPPSRPIGPPPAAPSIPAHEVRHLAAVVEYIRKLFNRVLEQAENVQAGRPRCARAGLGEPAEALVYREARALVQHAFDQAAGQEHHERDRVYALQKALFLFEALLLHEDAAAAAAGDGGGGEGAGRLAEEDVVTVTMYVSEISNQLVAYEEHVHGQLLHQMQKLHLGPGGAAAAGGGGVAAAAAVPPS